MKTWRNPPKLGMSGGFGRTNPLRYCMHHAQPIAGIKPLIACPGHAGSRQCARMQLRGRKASGRRLECRWVASVHRPPSAVHACTIGMPYASRGLYVRFGLHSRCASMKSGASLLVSTSALFSRWRPYLPCIAECAFCCRLQTCIPMPVLGVSRWLGRCDDFVAGVVA